MKFKLLIEVQGEEPPQPDPPYSRSRPTVARAEIELDDHDAWKIFLNAANEAREAA